MIRYCQIMLKSSFCTLEKNMKKRAVLISMLDNTNYLKEILPDWEWEWVQANPSPGEICNQVYEIKPDLVLLEHSEAHSSGRFCSSSRDTYARIANLQVKQIVIVHHMRLKGYEDSPFASMYDDTPHVRHLTVLISELMGE